jgi:hypothetical protein
VTSDDSVGDSFEVLEERYELREVLGEGALGRTYLARDLQRAERRVAVKELLPSRMKRWKDYDLFERECRTLRHLDHEGIPSYREDFIIEPESPSEPARLFLVQDFVEGRTLEAHIEEGRIFDEAEVRAIAEQVLEVLVYLHGLHPPVIHRDIKPSNLMFTEEGRVVLIDFGAVREAVTAEGIGSTIVGTFGYMPPEQYAGRSVPATDIFALGATCVELLTGRPPAELFEGIHEFRIPEDLPVTLGFERVLLEMTDPELEQRYASASEVLRDLRTGFLMVPKDALTGDLPIPYEIRPAPRPFPGFHLRDAYTGASHLGVVLFTGLGAVLSLVFPLTVLLIGEPIWAIPGFFVSFVTCLMAWIVSEKSRREIETYRRGVYTLGEVTGRFLSNSSETGVHLTYRYELRAGGFAHGCLSTGDRSYRELTPGDPIGVLYLPEEPSEHVMFAVPRDWARETVGRGRTRLLPASDADGAERDRAGHLTE